ncbi:Translation initiation factor IF6 like protein [Aduncisulcus paluster]|uniref:Eukaryotic translation initiation factor 6 n=1 Tax=Aduncisulcus paluster TaxID=2918883 RepID=A0ABQ5JRV4_9EUKA|nr:Translation initiation factor IF6 like protein [Aduncisulcus paluster]|eukprot:gnl/Carplike_NY0171/3379_a4547_500.p1 GENE.gnl/Carplike_NY0171/3379_a4547_500~~gnl/Carplike_NY0171/3379_a4547_500.p1  ORF type:complete len:248 (-),score=58.98 gnl/Carplike_NY0171/3379_a4547_500:29-772(-)
MAQRVRYESSSEIGVYSLLTNTYCLMSDLAPPPFRAVFESELSGKIPIISTSVAECSIIGRLCCGNSHGLILPSTTKDSEFERIAAEMPENVKVVKSDEKYTALGNLIACNDSHAICSPILSESTVKLIEETLEVSVCTKLVAGESLVGTFCKVTNKGALVHPLTPIVEQRELAKIFGVSVRAGTVNAGSELVGSGLVACDDKVFVGTKTTGTEIEVIKEVFAIKEEMPDELMMDLDKAIEMEFFNE